MAESRRPRRPSPRARGARRPAASSAAPTAPPTDGPVVELDVERVAHGGVFVAHHEGRVVFVPDAIPGERVRARITDRRHDRFWRAETLEVLDASHDRQEHVWAEASVERPPERRAGGAEFGHIRIDRQRALKAEVLGDALRRFGGVEHDVDVREIDPALAPGVSADGTGWRTRVRLQVAEDGAVGPYAARSHTVVPVASVPLAVASLGELAPLSSRFPGARAVDLVAPSVGEPALVVLDAERMPRSGPRPTITERVGDRTFVLDRDGFWQVHRGAAATLTRAVQDAVDPALFDPRAANLDLYGGVGLLAAAVGDRFGDAVRITTVEADTRATEHADANLAEWVGSRAVTARVDRFLDDLADAATADERARLRDATVVLDPPRSGAGRAVVDRLAELRPRQLVYVACDPVALARDVGLLRERGYALDELVAFDLFPNTHHVEAVARLTAIV